MGAVDDYAKSAGISTRMAYKRLKSGKISRLPDGSIDAAQAKTEWDQNKDVAQEQRSRSRPAKGTEQPGATGASFSDLQLAEKALKIKRAQNQLKQEEGQLLDFREVEMEWTARATRFKESVLAMASRVVSRLPTEWTREVFAAVDAEARHVLVALSDEIRADSKAA